MTFPTSTTGPITLPLAPIPLPDESIGSWVQRLCGSHIYSFVRLALITGLKPRMFDWDLGLEEDQQRAFLASAGLSEENFASCFLGRKDAPQIFLYDWARFEKSKPSYAWCPHCFATDVEPYLRWKWRLNKTTHCELHGEDLHTKCRHCWNELRTHRSLLLQSARAPWIPNLAYCGSCAAPLVDEIYLSPGSAKSIRSPFLEDMVRLARKIRPLG
jgi:TniQ